ncbi:MAG: alanyl-tRNA editing protein [Pseudomonadota bacterium]
MTTDLLFRADPYRVETDAVILGHTDAGGLIVDRSVFYPKGGGQPGDSGAITWTGGRLEIATTVREPDGAVALVPAEPGAMPETGRPVRQRLDWGRRYRHMRVHTALHLLSVVIPLPVTGGAIGTDKGRLDFMMPQAPQDRDALEEALNELVDRDLPVIEDWIDDAELEANPKLVKTMSVAPPRGSGRIRLVRIGEGESQVDLQPCGGTHVARTGEIGRVRLGKIENKGKRNRRVSLLLDN